METESITAPDAEEASMRELGIQTDAQEGRQVEAPEPTPQVEAQEQAPEPETPEVETADQTPEVPEPGRDHPQQRPRDAATGQFQKNGKPDTDYSRAQKEQARKDRSWQALQAEKEQFRQMTSQWEEQQRMAQLEAQARQYQPLKKDGLTAKQYFDGAQVFERDGDYENALKAYKVASEMGRAEQQNYQQFEHANKEYEWRRQMQEVSQIAPQIWDSNQTIHQHLTRIIQQNPGIYDLPNGFRLAAEAAYMLTEQERMKEKDDRIIELEAMVEKMQRKGQPARGGYASPRTDEKDFDSMDLNEMESHLKSLTAEADNYR